MRPPRHGPRPGTRGPGSAGADVGRGRSLGLTAGSPRRVRRALGSHPARRAPVGPHLPAPRAARLRSARRKPCRPRPADDRLGHALDDLRTAVVAVEADKACVDAEEQGCCWWPPRYPPA
ncbi:transcriptional regulator [Streptomyces flavotricini]|uniref:transcriptional regulator n=1 Tax=Streptomyces flavotricini TaxID=66888 RepID=UPI003559043E